MTGGYLAHQVRQRTIRPILAYREYIFRDVLPHFKDLDRRSEQIGNEYYDRAVSQPADEDFDGDLSGFAEDAHDHALGWYEMMRSLRQTMLNLLAAGLFHLAEQQLTALSQDAGFNGRRPIDSRLEVVAKWYLNMLRLDLRALADWNLIHELRLVANTAKHAEGGSSADLRTLRPDLFADPTLAGLFENTGFRDFLVSRPVSAPLAGEDLFVTEAALDLYAVGVERFFREIADHLDANDDEYY
jgi:hypothetical protein